MPTITVECRKNREHSMGSRADALSCRLLHSCPPQPFPSLLQIKGRYHSLVAKLNTWICGHNYHESKKPSYVHLCQGELLVPTHADDDMCRSSYARIMAVPLQQVVKEGPACEGQR